MTTTHVTLTCKEFTAEVFTAKDCVGYEWFVANQHNQVVASSRSGHRTLRLAMAAAGRALLNAAPWEMAT